MRASVFTSVCLSQERRPQACFPLLCSSTQSRPMESLRLPSMIKKGSFAPGKPQALIPASHGFVVSKDLVRQLVDKLIKTQVHLAKRKQEMSAVPSQVYHGNLGNSEGSWGGRPKACRRAGGFEGKRKRFCGQIKLGNPVPCSQVLSQAQGGHSAESCCGTALPLAPPPHYKGLVRGTQQTRLHILQLLGSACPGHPSRQTFLSFPFMLTLLCR